MRDFHTQLTAAGTLEHLVLSPPILCALLGGISWSFGPLGKRYGVSHANDSNRFYSSAATYSLLSIGTFIWPCGAFLWVESDKREAILFDPDWQSRLPVIFGCGMLSGIGGFLAVYALSYTTEAAFLVALVANGLYAVLSSVVLLVFWRERPTMLQWVSLVLATAAALLAEIGQAAAKRDAETAAASPEDPSAAKIITHLEQRSPAKKRSLGVFTAVVAAIFWSAGPLGKGYGAKGGAEALRKERTACTAFVYEVATDIPALAFALFASSGCLQGSVDSKFWQRSLWVALSGAVAGLGTIFGTYAMGIAPPHTVSLIQSVENGVFVIGSSLVIAVGYQEAPSKLQALSTMLMVIAFVLADTSIKAH